MILALELSSRRGSVALYDGIRVVAQANWDEPAARHAALFDAAPRLLIEAGVTWSHLTALAAGRGPGAFSGVRTALLAAQTFALPTRLPVLAVSSGEALAMDLADEAGGRPIVIAGDARRGAIWHAVFHPHAGGVRKAGDWALSPAETFVRELPEDVLLASPDAARLAAACPGSDFRPRGLQGDRYPDAARVAAWAWHTRQAGLPGEPLEPLYLHPAV